jgi:transposase InsO family protein
MDQRVEFVIRAKKQDVPFSTLCQQFGISRPTGYLWLRRYEQAGSLTALAELSRRPHASPTLTPQSVANAVVRIRDEKGWGARKIQALLARQQQVLPVSTVHRLLVRNGKVIALPALRHASKRFAREECNQLVQMDFKGEYVISGGKCYPLSLLDDHSRYLLGLWPLTSTKAEGVYEALKQLFQQEGVPQAILTDHGSPWYAASNGHGLTWLSVWLIKQSVRLIFSAVGHPQTQGKIERYHRTLDERSRHRGLPETHAEWLAWSVQFRQEYNHERPHEALAMKLPAEVYTRANLRSYEAVPREWEYSGGEVRRLNSQGSVAWEGQRYFVCEALADERVRVDEVDGKLVVTFRHMTIREIDLRSGRSRALVLGSPSESLRQ